MTAEAVGDGDVCGPPPPGRFTDWPPPPGEIDGLDWVSPEDLGTVMWRRAAHEGQRPPARDAEGGDWRTWVFLGGRGAGKTRAGAEWVWEQAARLRWSVGAAGRIALIAPTLHDARAVMIEGPSGLLNLPWRSGARFTPSLRRVRFPGGVLGLVFSAEEPERLRGPQFHAAWGDELGAWSRGEETLAMLRLGLRLDAAKSANARGAAARCLSAEGGGSEPWIPRLVLTSTPRPVRAVRGVLAEAGCVRTHAPTRANAQNLSPGFLDDMQALYGGTRRAAQELDGELLEVEGALFTRADIARARRVGETVPGTFDRVVVGVDPPAGTLSGEGGDACGIVVVARSRHAGKDGRGNDDVSTAWVLEDASVRGLSPHGWGARVARAAAAFGAERVVAEANQGGAMVESVLKTAGLDCPVRRVHARLGKRARAEPVAALYEQGRVAHCGAFPLLEQELMGMGTVEGDRSPDRADALVWAVTDLMIDAGDRPGPRLRYG